MGNQAKHRIPDTAAYGIGGITGLFQDVKAILNGWGKRHHTHV
jgi:hypothetical protein